MLNKLSRRLFLGGLIAAPAVVPAASLMPIRGVVLRPSLLLPEAVFKVVDQWGNVLGETTDIKHHPLIGHHAFDAQFEIGSMTMKGTGTVERFEMLWRGLTLHGRLAHPQYVSIGQEALIDRFTTRCINS